MFAKIASLLDEKLDSVLEPENEKEYSKIMSVIGGVLLSSLLIVLFSILLVYKGNQINAPQYFLIQDGKTIGKLPVLYQPSVSTQKVSRWSAKAIREIFTFNFENVDRKVQSNSVFFTPQAHEDFVNSMIKRKEFEAIKGNRLYSTATLLERPQLISTGSFQGKRIIRVEAPVVMTLLGGKEPVHKKQWIILYVSLVPSTESPEGVVIMKMDQKPY